MSHLIVGDNGCSYNDILKQISTCETFTNVRKDWRQIATFLDLSLKEQDDIDSGNPSAAPFIFMQKILVLWRSKASQGATLGVLVNTLELLSYNDMANKLKSFFKMTNSTAAAAVVAETTLSGAATNTSAAGYTNFKTLPQDIVDNMEDNKVEEMVGASGFQQNSTAFGFAGQTDVNFLDFRKLFSGQRRQVENLHAVEPNKVFAVKVIRPIQPMTFPQDYYNLPTGFKGYALIINALQFQNAEYHRYGVEYHRYGAAVDTHHLVPLFEQLGYKTVSHNDSQEDFTESRIEKILDEFKRKCVSDKVSSFVVFLGSHGKEAQLQLSNGKHVDIYKEIVYKLCDSPAGETWWASIPKMFFVQACRPIPTDDATTQRVDNCILAFSCLPGRLANRDPDYGTYYVTSLTRVLMENAFQWDLETMLDKVNKIVWAETEKLQHRQQPDYHALGKFGKLFFNMEP